MSLAIAPAYADSTKFLVYDGIKQRNQPVRPIRIAPEIQAYLHGEILNGLLVIQPFQINIEREEDQSYIVSDDLFLVYGNGGNLSDAINDYVMSLVEFYQILERNANSNLFDQKQFASLQTYIQPKLSGGNYAVQTDRS